jgi:hypothetical protein
VWDGKDSFYESLRAKSESEEQERVRWKGGIYRRGSRKVVD